MAATVFEAISNELALVHGRIAGELRLKAGNVPDLIPFDFCLHEQCLLPSLVILSARFSGDINNRVISMAAAMELAYLAQQIHNRIGEEDQPAAEPPGSGPQLPVLVGDYIFGKFLLYVCEAGCLEFLPVLADIVCQMNEGGVIRKDVLESGQGSTLTTLRVIKKETALLFAESCRIGATIGGASADFVATLREFGLQLGMAVGCHQFRQEPGLVENYLGHAKEELRQLPSGRDRDLLEKLAVQILITAQPQARCVPPAKRVTGNLAVAHF